MSHRMKDKSLTPTDVTNVAALGGFLEGISFLSKDCRSNFAEAFIVDASDDGEFLTDIRSRFTHLSGFALELDNNFRGGFRQLEQDITSLLLTKPHVGNEQLAKDMRSYLSFKIMDRLGEIRDRIEFDEPKRFVGTHDETDGTMIFYLLRSPEMSFVLYFFSTMSNS
jgi:hypothetical protein